MSEIRDQSQTPQPATPEKPGKIDPGCHGFQNRWAAVSGKPVRASQPFPAQPQTELKAMDRNLAALNLENDDGQPWYTAQEGQNIS